MCKAVTCITVVLWEEKPVSSFYLFEQLYRFCCLSLTRVITLSLVLQHSVETDDLIIFSLQFIK